jgi:hypothetical protein
MVRIRRAAMGCILLLALGSCQVLFVGVFPASAGQITARADLSASIAAAPASSFLLKRVVTGGAEYFLLFSPVGFDGAQAHVLVLDDSLRVLNTYTSNDLGGPPGSPYAMTDVNGNVIIGGVLFTPQPNGLVFVGGAPVALTGPSVTGLPLFPSNEVNFSVSGGFLTWAQWDQTWAISTPEPPSSVAVGGPSSLFLSDVLTEVDSAGMPDVFVLRGNNNTTYLLLLPKDLIDSGNLAGVIATSIFADLGPLGLIVQKSNLDNSIGLAYGEVFAYDHDSESLIHFNLKTPDSMDKMPMKWSRGSQVAAGVSGTFCVVWDPASRTVSKYDQWWQ